jgi:hypothetical protein
LSFVELQLYSKIVICLVPLKKLTHMHSYRIDGELVPEPEREKREARINLTEVIKYPNQSLEEPKASFAQEGKPRSITPIFKLKQLLLIYGIVH